MKGTGRRGRWGGGAGGKGTRGQVVKGPVGSHTPALWLTKQFLCARCPWKLCQTPWAVAQTHLPLCSHAAPLPQAWLSQAAVGVGGCRRLCPPSWGLHGSQPSGARKVYQVSQHAHRGERPPYPSPHLSAPSISTRLWAWVCVCCLLSQSSYYG